MKKYGQNNFTVMIGNPGETLVDYTSRVPFPIKWSNLLDEQLDEATLTILRTKTETFPPFTAVTISWRNGDDATYETKTYFVATDKAEEIPPGSGRYNHELYLIEETKWLERFIILSTGFVNALGRTYVTDD